MKAEPQFTIRNSNLSITILGMDKAFHLHRKAGKDYKLTIIFKEINK
jgi:hypothetical protein